ncbi:MAG: lipid kinase [Desulfuromonadales bacterium]|nr:lipid kinase [Desulfuromonadales bacterium]
MPHALVVVNRTARGGAVQLQAGMELLQAAGFSLTEIITDEPASIPILIGQHRGNVDLVIIGGGDGTFNTAAPAVVDSGLPMGILPLGTANDLARTLGIPPDIEQACRIIAAGTKRSIDIGEVNGHLFFNTASIGLSVGVTHRLSPELKARWGALAYARGGVAAWRGNQPFTADIDCDGQKLRHRSIQIAVGNGRHYGGGMTIAADAAIDDHLLNLYSLEPQSFWRLLALAPWLRRGEYHHRAGVKLMSGQVIEIRTRRPLPIDTDGELTTQTPARFRVRADAVDVFVPLSSLGKADVIAAH